MSSFDLVVWIILNDTAGCGPGNVTKYEHTKYLETHSHSHTHTHTHTRTQTQTTRVGTQLANVSSRQSNFPLDFLYRMIKPGCANSTTKIKVLNQGLYA